MFESKLRDWKSYDRRTAVHKIGGGAKHRAFQLVGDCVLNLYEIFKQSETSWDDLYWRGTQMEVGAKKLIKKLNTFGVGTENARLVSSCSFRGLANGTVELSLKIDIPGVRDNGPSRDWNVSKINSLCHKYWV